MSCQEKYWIGIVTLSLFFNGYLRSIELFICIYICIISPLGEMQLVYSHDTRGCVALKGETINRYIMTKEVIYSQFDINFTLSCQLMTSKPQSFRPVTRKLVQSVQRPPGRPYGKVEQRLVSSRVSSFEFKEWSNHPLGYNSGPCRNSSVLCSSILARACKKTRATLVAVYKQGELHTRACSTVPTSDYSTTAVEKATA